MSDRREIRKAAYQYIWQKLGQLQPSSGAANDGFVISLDELSSLKDGTADPSPEMVALVRSLLGHAVGDAEIEANLVTPFRDVA